MKKERSLFYKSWMLLFLLLLGIFITASPVYAAAPADENFNDDSSFVNTFADQFVNDGIKYTPLGGSSIGTFMSNDGISPLGDNGLDYYMNVGTYTLLKIEAEDGSNFYLKGLAIDAVADANVLITPSGGGDPVTLVSGGSYVTQMLDFSANADFKNISYVTISGDNLLLCIDDLDFEEAILPTHTVTYDGNTNTGGDVPTDGNSYTNGNTVTVLGNAGNLVKTGYTFSGWNTAANGSGDGYVADDTFAMGSSNVTLYAQWTLDDYMITYNANSATGGSVPVDGTTYHYGNNTTAATNSGSLVRTGYTFNGWNTQANGGGTHYATSGAITMTGSLTLYAQWTLDDYTITYNANSATGGSVPVDGTTYHYGGNTNAATNSGSLVRTGYTFNGWNTQANGGGTHYATSGAITMTSSLTLYAEWIAIDYSVTYNANTADSGSVPVDGNTYNITNTVTVLGNTGSLVKTGYTFTGWNTAANGSGTTYSGGGTFAMGSSNMTLYAKWALDDYTITYNANSATGGSVPVNGTTYHYGDNTTAATNSGSLVRTGYNFNGWNTQANGAGTHYAESDAITMTSSLTLYAEWTPIDYSVTYNGNGNDGGAAPTDGNTYHITNTVTVLGNTGSLVKTGYTFTGWNTAANGSGTTYSGGGTFAIGSSNVTLYAKWTPDDYSITYNANSATSGSVPVDGTTYHYGDNTTAATNSGSLVRTGYNFNGWNTQANGGGTHYAESGAITMTGSLTLYAEWTAIDYSVTYNGNGNDGGAVPTDGNIYHITNTVTVPGNTGSLVKTGYTFTGWNTAANGSGTTYSGGATFAMGSSNVTLYAKWTPDDYTITYNSNSATGGSVPVDGTTYHYGGNTTAATNSGSLVRTGYNFNGWNTQANGSGTHYAASGAITMTSSLTLYAEWTPIDYSVTYNGNGNDGGAAPTDGNTYHITNTVTVPGNTGSLVKTGYTFTGWNTAANGSGTTYSGGGTFAMGSSNVTLYAQWAINSTISPVTASFDKNTSSQADIEITMTLNGNTLSNIKNGADTLAFGTDYTVSGSAVTISKVYLANQVTGTITLTFNFNAGSAQTLAITVTDSTQTGSPSPNSSTKPSTVLEVNGESQSAGTTSTSTNSDGQTVTTVTVDTVKLDKALESAGNHATVTIPVTNNSDVAIAGLTGQMIKNMESKEATLEVKTGSATYTLPALEINIDSVSKQLGQDVTLSDIKVQIQIAVPSAESVKVVENSAKTGDFTIMVPAVEFEINCTYNGKTVDVNKFNSYVERTVAIPDGVDPAKITTGVVVNSDGTVRHVPTQVIQVNGKYYAKINSLTNSTYTVIWNPITFTDVENHWAKASVNNMGSRMVVTGMGNGNYNPNSDITRAEFAAIIIRALGLETGLGENSFSDVKTTDWFCDYVETAREYGIINGYNKSTFAPNDKITREQAFVMIARAIKITGIIPTLTDDEISTLLAGYTDAAGASGYTKSSIASCLKTGIISGTGNNKLTPKSNITRAEVAVIVERLLKKSELI